MEQVHLRSTDTAASGSTNSELPGLGKNSFEKAEKKSHSKYSACLHGIFVVLPFEVLVAWSEDLDRNNVSITTCRASKDFKTSRSPHAWKKIPTISTFFQPQKQHRNTIWRHLHTASYGIVLLTCAWWLCRSILIPLRLKAKLLSQLFGTRHLRWQSQGQSKRLQGSIFLQTLDAYFSGSSTLRAELYD